MIGKTNGNLYTKIGGQVYEQLINYTILYDYGNVGESGDWEAKRITNSTDSKDIAFSSTTFTKNADNIYIYGVYNSNKNSRLGAFTKNKFNMYEYNKMFVKSAIGTYGKNIRVNVCTFLEDNTDEGVSATTYNQLYNVPSSGTSLTVSLPSYVGNISTTGNRKIAFEIVTMGYYSNIGAYLYHLTLFKPDDFLTLAEKAEITATTIDEILNNSEILLNNKDAVNFMLKQCTGDFMITAVKNSTFLAALNDSPYKTIIQANEHWNKFLNLTV